MALCNAVGKRLLGPNVYPEAPDGGWGWVVAGAFFFVEVFTYGTIKSFGIFLKDLTQEFGETNSRVSWIISISVFVMTFNAPLSSVMTSRFGFQLVVMIGGVLISTGAIASSFTSSLSQMYFTYGLIVGLGYCLTYLPTVTILAQYFNRRRSLVISIASTGESLSMFALAPAYSVLRDKIGWRHTMAVIGALQGTIVICGALLRPIIIQPRAAEETENGGSSSKELEALATKENVEGTNLAKSMTSNASLSQDTSHRLYNGLSSGSVGDEDSGGQPPKDSGNSRPEKETLLDNAAEQKSVKNSLKEIKEPESEKKKNGDVEKPLSRDYNLLAKMSKLLDFSILRECSFIFYSLFGLFATLGFFAPHLYIIELSVSRGVGREHATYMLSTMAVAEIFGRFAIGWILSRRRLMKSKLHVLLVCSIIMTLVLVGFTLVTEFYGLAVCCAFYGFLMGTLTSTHIPMLAEDDVVGIERMSSAAGIYVFIHSFSGLAGPPLGGVLVDVTQDYGSAFYSCAVGMALSSLFLGLVKPAKRGFICRRRSEKHSQAKRGAQGDSEEQGALNKAEDRTDAPGDCPEVRENSICKQRLGSKMLLELEDRNEISVTQG